MCNGLKGNGLWLQVRGLRFSKKIEFIPNYVRNRPKVTRNDSNIDQQFIYTLRLLLRLLFSEESHEGNLYTTDKT